jgi:transposase
MMGYQDKADQKLFHYGINLEERIRSNHPLRKIKEIIDFDFIREEVKNLYGYNGNESIDPSVIIRMIFLLFYYDVRSERELILTIPERLDWMWFLDYDLDAEVPNHSVISKARSRWGVEAFRQFFTKVLESCCEKGLVSGEKIYCDATIIDADASNNSVVEKDSLKLKLHKRCKELEKKLDEKDDEKKRYYKRINTKKISTTDPDAGITRQNKGKPKLRYKAHRAVDGQEEIITASIVTSGDVNDGHCLTDLIEQHEENTKENLETVVADSLYGTRKNIIECVKRGIRPHLKDLLKTQKTSGGRDQVFGGEEFIYDKDKDVYICPAGKELKKRKCFHDRAAYEYVAKKSDCAICRLKDKCTRGKFRTLKRHIEQEDLETGLRIGSSLECQKDLKTRQHLMERSFAVGKARYGLGRARWRRLWRVEIQELMTATIQNIQKLMKHTQKPLKALTNKKMYYYSYFFKNIRNILRKISLSKNLIAFGQQPVKI